MRLCLCLCANENSIRQISGFVLLMFLLMLTLMSRVFLLVLLMLCLCASENQPLLTYLSCAVFTSNTFDISISIRKMNSSVFLVLMFMLMSNALLVKTAQDK